MFQSLSIQQPFHGFRHQVLVIHAGWDHVAKWCNRTDLCLTKDVAADAGKPIKSMKNSMVVFNQNRSCLEIRSRVTWTFNPSLQVVDRSFITRYSKRGVFNHPSPAGWNWFLPNHQLDPAPGAPFSTHVDVSWCFFLHEPYKSFYFCSIMCLAYNYLLVVSLCDGFSFVFVAMAITCHALSDKIGSTLSPEWGFCNGAQLQPQKCDLQACKHVIFTILCN